MDQEIKPDIGFCPAQDCPDFMTGLCEDCPNKGHVSQMAEYSEDLKTVLIGEYMDPVTIEISPGQYMATVGVIPKKPWRACCPTCGFDWSGLTYNLHGGICPECGDILSLCEHVEGYHRED